MAACNGEVDTFFLNFSPLNQWFGWFGFGDLGYSTCKACKLVLVFEPKGRIRFFLEHPESPEVESDVAGAAFDIFSDLDFTSTTIEASHGLGLFWNGCWVMRLEGKHNCAIDSFLEMKIAHSWTKVALTSHILHLKCQLQIAHLKPLGVYLLVAFRWVRPTEDLCFGACFSPLFWATWPCISSICCKGTGKYWTSPLDLKKYRGKWLRIWHDGILRLDSDRC